MDERYAVVDVAGKGLVIFSAYAFVMCDGSLKINFTIRCSHAGIVNVVKDAVQRFSRPIHMVGSDVCPSDLMLTMADNRRVTFGYTGSQPSHFSHRGLPESSTETGSNVCFAHALLWVPV